jgi:hypothetical protein
MGRKGSGSDAGRSDRTEVARQAIEGLERIRRGPDNKTGSDERSAAERVKAFMNEKHLDIPAFAKMIGRSVRTVGSVLADAPLGKGTRRAVAEALGTSPEELFLK